MFSPSDTPPQVDPAAPAPHHRFGLRGRQGALSFDASAELQAPWSVLFGASGSGKTTLLRAICGLLPPSRHSGSTLDLSLARREPPTEWTVLADRNGFLPAQDRGIAYAPQAPLLFPHLSVRENVCFGTESQRAPTPLAEEAAELFELAPLWSRLPAQLSGGEQQRVNLARGFARPNTRLLLLDEPFTGMDRSLRDRLLARLRPALAARGLPVLSVTHDVEEAFLLEAEVLRLEGGRIVAQAPVARALAAEAEHIRAALRE